MRYDAEHKRKTRERVLEEAAKAIRVEGPHQVGVAGVMAKAGLTHGGFYAHFKSKDDLVAETISQMFTEGSRRLANEIDNNPPAMALRNYVNFYLSRSHRDTLTAGCPLPYLAADAPRLAGLSRERFAAGVQDLRRKLAGQLTLMEVDEAEGAASSLLAELVGALSLARAEPDVEKSDAILQRSRQAIKTASIWSRNHDRPCQRTACRGPQTPTQRSGTAARLDRQRSLARIGATLDFDMVEAEEGRVVFEGTPSEAVYNPIGTVHGGYAATLLDSACGCAVHTKLGADQGYTTLELKVAYHKAMTASTGPVRAEGKIITIGRRAAFAEARITDASGRLYASATSTLLVFDR